MEVQSVQVRVYMLHNQLTDMDHNRRVNYVDHVDYVESVNKIESVAYVKDCIYKSGKFGHQPVRQMLKTKSLLSQCYFKSYFLCTSVLLMLQYPYTVGIYKIHITQNVGSYSLKNRKGQKDTTELTSYWVDVCRRHRY